jgi:hypothetical protein
MSVPQPIFLSATCLLHSVHRSGPRTNIFSVMTQKLSGTQHRRFALRFPQVTGVYSAGALKREGVRKLVGGGGGGRGQAGAGGELMFS